MKHIPYIVTDESITVVVGGKPYTISKSNASFIEVKNRIATQDFAGIEQLFNQASAVGSYTKGNIVVKNGEVLYKGRAIHNHVVDRILDFIRQGLPYQPLVNFLDKLLQNPSARAVAELYTFLEHKNMPLTADGNFWAYKGVQSNFYSVHSGNLTLLKGNADGANNTGHINNNVGQEVECPRNEVSDNTSQGCAQGLHAGSLSYAQGWGARMVIVEINPADVVCVPTDCNCQKMRCCHYKVVGTFERAYTEPLVGGISAPQANAKTAVSNEVAVASKELGFEAGSEDAEDNLVRNAEEAFAEIDNESFEEIDEQAFIEGYHEGFDTFYAANRAVSAPVARVGKKTISEATRQKLRDAAKRQKRDADGRYI